MRKKSFKHKMDLMSKINIVPMILMVIDQTVTIHFTEKSVFPYREKVPLVNVTIRGLYVTIRLAKYLSFSL